MKKVLLFLFSIFMLCGCSKDNSSVLNEFEKKVSELNNYHMLGDLTIYSDEDKYLYSVDVTYKKGDYYKVSLINKDNSHEQIILKNDEGVYVVTPSLNKSFKFQSEWPSNSSQSYILECVLNDIKKDSERSILNKDSNYEISSSVNYPNNTDLTSQIVTISKETMLPSSIIIKDKSGSTKIMMKVTKIDTNTKYDKEYFSLASNIKYAKNENSEKTVSSIKDSVVYPMYLPSGTTYTKEELVSTDNSERIILTYSGVKPFILIEENSKVSSEHETTNVSGEIVLHNNILGVMSNSSLNWNENGREYYLIGEDLSKEELIKIASSTINAVITK